MNIKEFVDLLEGYCARKGVDPKDVRVLIDGGEPKLLFSLSQTGGSVEIVSQDS